jgi:hypothetical protein
VRLTGNDWGLHTTAGDFLADVEARAGALGLNDAAASRVTTAAVRLRTAMDEAPKSLRWRARERVGRRMKWYRDVEEVL